MAVEGLTSARETYFGPCVKFVADAMTYAGGNLNTRTVGYVLRFYLFVFYFVASVPAASSWPNTLTSSRNNDGTLKLHPADIPLLEDPRSVSSNNKRLRYFPGGAPQAESLALKEVVSLIIGRMRELLFPVEGDGRSDGSDRPKLRRCHWIRAGNPGGLG